jgi:hypothetical protein
MLHQNCISTTPVPPYEPHISPNFVSTSPVPHTCHMPHQISISTTPVPSYGPHTSPKLCIHISCPPFTFHMTQTDLSHSNYIS